MAAENRPKPNTLPDLPENWIPAIGIVVIGSIIITISICHTYYNVSIRQQPPTVTIVKDK